VATSRIYLSYHTPKQVVVGVAAGAIFAFVWFGFTTYLRRAGWIEWALETWIARMFRVRDLVVQEDLVDSGWARWVERRQRGNFRNQGKKSR
jgi:dolichyldiphosphatase